MSSRIDQIFKNAEAENRRTLFEHEAKTIMMEKGITTPKFKLVNTPEDAVKAAQKFGYPVVLKIVSPQIIHKSDIGGVLLNLNEPDEVITGYETIINNLKIYEPKAEIKGILVQKMAPSSHEIIIGTTTDPQFGPTLMLGMGGIYVEIYRDVTFRVVPLNKTDAKEMISELKGLQILKGYRGQPPSDFKAIIDLLLKVSNLVMSHTIIDQIDLNPILVYEKGIQVVDARIILKEEFLSKIEKPPSKRI